MLLLRRLLMATVLVLGIVASAVPIPLPASKRTVANDTTAFNLGPHKPGKFTSGTIEFEFASAGVPETCGAVILMPGQTKKVRLEIPADASGDTLYLLHAGKDCGKSKNAVGKVALCYSDGKTAVHPMQNGVEAAEFTGNRGCGNAVRAFSIYNGVTQISLYATKIPCQGKLTAIELEAGDVPWMVAAVSIDKDAKIPLIRPQTRAKKRHRAIPLPSADIMAKVSAQEKEKVKNIIFIIGDGMGAGAREFTSRLVYGKPNGLPSDQFPFQTRATTRSANSSVTDSAASGTALGGGYKTNNGFLGVSPKTKKFLSIASMAHKAGYAVGILTTEAITGATPAAFYAHVPNRTWIEDITAALTRCGFDVMVGTGEQYFRPEKRKDKKDLIALLAEQNMVTVKTLDEMAKAPAEKRVLCFNTCATPEDLGKTVEIALRRLKNDKGLFMMIECSWPDAGGHGNNPDASAKGVLGVEAAAVAALAFAAENPGTLIVVTSDHETGGIEVFEAKDGNPVMVKFSSSSHTGATVPFMAIGSGSRDFPETLDNTDIPKIFAKQLNVQLMQIDK